MKNLFNNLVEAYPKSKKHLIGFPITLVVSFLFAYFNLMGWNEIQYNDEYPFIGEFVLPPFYGQSIIILLVSGIVNWFWEYNQQRGLKEKPTFKDTIYDTVYFMGSSYIAFVIGRLILNLI